MIAVIPVTNTFNNWYSADGPDIEELNPTCFGDQSSRHKLIVSRELWMDDFDRHGPFCTEMRSSIDRAHASFSEELFDPIFVIECVHCDFEI